MSETEHKQRAPAWVPAGFSLLLLIVGASVIVLFCERPMSPFLDLPWFVLIPAYLVAMRVNLGFERRGTNVNITLTQLPLVLGLVLVDPVLHLLARAVASVIYSVIRRHDGLKTLVNLTLVALELSAASVAVTMVATVDEPSVALWVALFLGLLAGDWLAGLTLSGVLWLLGRPSTFAEVGEDLTNLALTSLVFTGLGVLAITAAFTNPWTLVVMGGLGAGLGLAYRLYRRMRAQQSATESLYAFVRDLGAIDVSQPETMAALERIRVLLHAVELELHYHDPSDGSRPLLLVRDGHEAVRDVEPAAIVSGSMPTDLTRSEMSTPLLADRLMLGMLVARQRLDNERGFDMRDMRLLETVAAELATALERGRLLRDLGLAATRDPLTGLSNLRRTVEEIDELLLRGDVLLAAVAVDSFREVNDTLGHVVGDELLGEVAERLRRAAPEAAIGRIGGGRFAVAVSSEHAVRDPDMFGLSLRTNVEGGVQLGAIGTHIRMSVGCARGPEHGADAATLLRRAETAMYSARHAHGGPVVWEPAYEVQGQRRLAVVMALREALASGALGVAYQPKVLATTGQVTGVEALARWTHPALGSITPDEFVPLAEASGLMGILTSSVLRQALTACKGWQRRGGAVGVAVNVSADTILDPDFVTEVAAVLTSVGVPAHMLTLELTEGVVVADPTLAAERMLELRALGVKLSVDDFGTGYSSLTYLKGLPIDEVKIDKGFVGGLVDDVGDQAIVRAVVDIAHTLGMTVVAEGVEQEDQQSLLRLLGVDQLQGYLFARPMPALGMSAWLRRTDRMIRPADEGLLDY